MASKDAILYMWSQDLELDHYIGEVNPNFEFEKENNIDNAREETKGTCNMMLIMKKEIENFFIKFYKFCHVIFFYINM